MATEFDFGRDILGQNGYGPGVGTRAAARVAYITFQKLTLLMEARAQGVPAALGGPAVGGFVPCSALHHRLTMYSP